MTTRSPMSDGSTTNSTTRTDFSRRFRRRAPFVFVLASLLATAACEDSVEPGFVVPAEIVVTPWSVRLLSLSDTLDLSVQVLSKAGRVVDVPVRWSIEGDPTIESLGGGRFRSVANGVSTVVVELDGLTGAPPARVGVVVDQQPATIGLNTTLVDLWSLGERLQLTADVRDARGFIMPAHGDSVTWNSLDPRVAEVDAQGLLRAVGDGPATVTAWMRGLTGEVDVQVSSEFELTGCFSVEGYEGEQCHTTDLTVVERD